MSETSLTARGRRTRQSLVNAATEVFVRKGLFDARIADITEAAGVSAAAFYRYFETKNDILGEAVDNARDSTLEALRARGAEERRAPVFTRFTNANQRYFRAYQEQSNVIRMLEQRLAIDESFRLARRDWHPAFVGRLEVGLRRMQDDGDLAADVDVLKAAPTMSAMVENIAYVHFLLRGDERMPVHVERNVHMLWANTFEVPWDVGDLPAGMRRPRAAAPEDCIPLAHVAPPPLAFAPPTSRKGIATRTQLLRAAQKVFSRLGYLDARVADIAAQAKVAHGTFYNYFESRYDVFCVLADSLTSEMMDSIDATHQASDDVADMIRRDVETAAAFYERNARMFAVLEQFASIDAEAAAFRLLLRARFVRLLARSISRLQQMERADRRLHPIAAASALVSSFDRSMFEWYVLEVPHRTDLVAADIADVWMRALRVDRSD